MKFYKLLSVSIVYLGEFFEEFCLNLFFEDPPQIACIARALLTSPLNTHVALLVSFCFRIILPCCSAS